MFCFTLWLTSSHNNFKTYHHILQPYVKFEKKNPLILHYILVLYLGLVLEHWIKMCLSKVQMYMECSYLTSLWNKSSTDAWLKLGAILAALYFAEAEGIKKYINIIRYNLCQILLPKKKKKKKRMAPEKVKMDSCLVILALYTLTSICIFSIRFSIHFLRFWPEEFVSQSRAS